MSIAVILGAGFSKCAGLPIQSEFPEYLLSPELSQTSSQKTITKVIKQFLMDIFGWRSSFHFPTLEDYFTCLDLSANTGHHLGFCYEPKKLRAIRRMTIYRIFQILDKEPKENTPSSQAINDFLKWVRSRDKVDFVVTNWDIVLEKRLKNQGLGDKINYGFECYKWGTPHPKYFNHDDIIISKMNGSSNWGYCENCARIFYDTDVKRPLHEKVDLNYDDFKLFDNKLKKKEFYKGLDITPKDPDRECYFCSKVLATHIATFSFRKSYRTFAYPVIWHNAQIILSKSKEWIFVGYSLPDADFEFKHLLKTGELALQKNRKNKLPHITVVVYDDKNAENRFHSFFGQKISRICQGGLKEFVQFGIDKYPKKVL